MLIIRITGTKAKVNRAVEQIRQLYQTSGKAVAEYTEPSVPEFFNKNAEVIIIRNVVEV